MIIAIVVAISSFIGYLFGNVLAGLFEGVVRIVGWLVETILGTAIDKAHLKPYVAGLILLAIGGGILYVLAALMGWTMAIVLFGIVLLVLIMD